MSCYFAKIPKSGPEEECPLRHFGPQAMEQPARRAAVPYPPSNEYKRAARTRRGHSRSSTLEAMDEFQEADILWPDTAPSQQDEDALFVMPSEMYELAASASSGASLLGASEGFLSGAPPTAGASSGADEELHEADVLWPDTVQADEPRGGAGGFGWFRGGFARAGRQAKPAAAAVARCEGWRPAVSSPIDIPAKAAARCR